MEDFNFNYNRAINCLLDKDKSIKIRALKDLQQNLSKRQKDFIQQFFSNQLKGPLLTKLSDPSDQCKELAISILQLILPAVHSDDIPHIINALQGRLGKMPFPETCEQIRILETSLLKSMVNLHTGAVSPQLSNIADMLSKLARDACPAVKKLVCETVVDLSQNSDLKIGFFGKQLTESIKLNLGFQRYEIRLMSIQALGELALCENGSQIVEILIGDLKKLQTDRRVQVKYQLYQVIYKWMLYLPYTCLVKVETSLLHLFLGGIADLAYDSSAIFIKNQMLQRLEDMGNRRKYLSSQFSEQIDQLVNSNGINFILRKNLQEEIKKCLADIQEWTIEDISRSRAVTTIKFLAKITQRHIEPYLQSIIKSFVKACSQSDSIEYQSLFYQSIGEISFHCEFQSLFQQLSRSALAQLSSPSQSAVSLRFFTEVLQQAPTISLQQTVSFITSVNLASNQNSQVLEATHQSIRTLIDRQRINCASFKNQIFYGLLLLESTGNLSSVQQTVENLAECCGLLSGSQLYALQLPETLPLITSNYKFWDSFSTNRSWFRTLVVKSGSSVFPYIQEILRVVSFNCQRQKDSEVRFDMLVVLENILNHQQLYQVLSQQSQKLISEIIVPTAAWKVGASSYQVRIGSVICLRRLLQNRIILPQKITELWSSLFPVIHTCMTDDSERELRQVACQSVLILVHHYFENIQDFHINEVSNRLLERLDDSQDHIRTLAASALSVFLTKLKDKEYKFSNFEYLLSILFVHLDDPSEKIRQAISQVLKAAGEYKREELLEKAKQVKDKHRYQREVTELIFLFEVNYQVDEL